MEQIEIRNLNIKIGQLKEDYAKELNTTNYFYWPIIARLKKSIKNSKWLFFFSIFVLVSAIIICLLKKFYISYKIIAISISFLFLGICVIWVIFSQKKYNKVNNAWNIALKRANVIQDEKNKLSHEAIVMMLNIINDQKIEESLGSSYDEVLEYYNSWVE